MKTTALIICAALLGLCRVSYAQNTTDSVHVDPRHIVILSSGLSTHAARDAIMSPLMYRGTFVPITLAYYYHGSEFHHAVQLSYGASELASSITNTPARSHYINTLHLAFEYSFSINALHLDELHTEGFIGVRLSSLLNLRNHFFLKGGSHSNAEQMTGLGVSLLTETSFQQQSLNSLRCEIGFPVISYALLTHHYNANVSTTIDDIDYERSIPWQIFTQGELVSFNTLFELEATVSYRVFLSAVVGVDLQYRFHYYSFEQFEDTSHARVLTNQFLLGVMVAL